ncbi:MAG: hypothetical protein H0U21_00755 [Acidimicrobiia bacterium]|nr:hypothetical protein [Acidimicrobiia bacterium]
MTDHGNDAHPPRPNMDRRRFLFVTALGGAGALVLQACRDDSTEPVASEPSTSADGTSTTEPPAGAGPTPTSEPATSSSGPATSFSEPSTSSTTEDTTLAPAARPTVRLPFGAFGFPSPFASNGGIGYIQMSLIYDTLLWKDSTGELLPWLAASVERSADNLTYTFELRDGVQWNDGEPCTAADVVFTLDYYAQQEALPPPVIGQPPQGIAKVEATGPTTVTITLESPDVTFAEQVAGTIPILPKHVWSAVSDPTVPQDPAVLVGTGAYRLDSYGGDGSPLLYTANDRYFLGPPFVERIEFIGVDDPFTALQADATDAGSGSGLRADVIAPFTNDSSYGVITEKGSTAIALYWNLTKGGVLADKVFRQACAMAIDRDDLVARLAGGNGQPGNAGFLGPENPYLTAVEQHDLDVPGANALLDSAGYATDPDGARKGPDGTPLGFELLVSITDTPAAELVAAALEQIGVVITIKSVEAGPQLFGAKFSGGYEMALLGFPGPSAGGPNGDPDLLRRVFASTVPPSLTGASGYVNPTFDELAARQRATFDEAERKSIVAEMQEIIAEDIPILALYAPDTTFVFRKAVLDQWYFTPGRYPIDIDNKQLFITGVNRGIEIRPTD